jgi:hypothetical protein
VKELDMLRNRFAARSERALARAAVLEPLEDRTLFTVLTFAPATGTWANYTALSQNYGDRVTAATQNGFKYGTTGGTTAHVLALYGGTGWGTASTWTTGYGDLNNIVFPNPNGTKFHMSLTADAGFNVTLSGFDMAGYGTDYTINSVKVLDGNGATLFSRSSVKILGPAGTTKHTHFTFATPLKASKLQINFDSTNQGGYDVGIDNVQFSEVALATTKISGFVFNDANANGTKGSTESNLSGWRVYIDANNNGMYDSGETSVLTDTSGNYSFTFNTPGTYIVSVQLKRGYYQTAPHSLIYTVHAPGSSVTNAFFGVKTIAPA